MFEDFGILTQTWAPGLFSIDVLRLFSVDSSGQLKDEFDIAKSKALVGVEINQGIFQGSIEAQIILNDAFNMHEDFNEGFGLQGEEFVQIVLSTPGVSGERGIDLQFLVLNVEYSRSTTNETSGVVLNCISKEFLINSVNNVNQAFEGTTSDVASNVFNNRINGDKLWGKFLSYEAFRKRPFGVDPSTGIDDLIITGLSPFAAVNMLGRRSDGGPSHPHSLFLFFENTNGYQFRNIQKLIKDNILLNESKLNRKYTYRSTDAADKSMARSQRTTIKALTSVPTPTPIQRLKDGIYKNHTRMVNIIAKSYEDINYEHTESFLGTSHSNNPDFTDNLSNFFDREYLFFNDITKKSQGFQKVLAKRLSFMDFLGTHQLTLQLTGDTSLQAGEVIQLDLPPSAHIIKEVGESSKFSGAYLIMSVKHVFDKDKLLTSITIAKDSLNTAADTTQLASIGGLIS